MTGDLPAELERDRHEVGRSRHGDLPADAAIAREEEVIELKLGEGRADVRPAREDGELERVEGLRDELMNERAGRPPRTRRSSA